MLIKHISSPILTVIYCFIGLCFVDWVSDLIVNWSIMKQTQTLSLYNRDNWKWKNYLFIATEDRSQDLIFDSPMLYPLF